MSRKRSLRDRLSSHRLIHTEEFLGRGNRTWSSDPYFVYPTTNVKKNKEFFDLEIAVPGFAKEDLEISIRQGVLLVRGKKEVDTDMEGNNFIRKEHDYESFERAFQLEDYTDEERIEASYSNGLLKIRLYHKEGHGPTDMHTREVEIH